jgi:hypothetical protein
MHSSRVPKGTLVKRLYRYRTMRTSRLGKAIKAPTEDDQTHLESIRHSTARLEASINRTDDHPF